MQERCKSGFGGRILSEIIPALRAKIDALDEKIIRLLDARMGYVARIGEEKARVSLPIYNPAREEAIIKNLCALPLEHLDREALERLYREIFALAREVELPQSPKISGASGANSTNASGADAKAAAEPSPQATPRAKSDSKEGSC